MPRAVDQWQGATPDTPIPGRVKIRVWERYGGVCQCGCGTKIFAKPIEFDDAIALINGGENRESNRFPCCPSITAPRPAPTWRPSQRPHA